ncbi:ubiquitin carboxyl-terminal hydrolase 47 isoform X3 [Sitodiplosis mosellana]|uniref:ubiquitin carboxyl-terminal hydrolase 47 isoform X3 n=2 Tax=Sitodiplosis mosellana TaxID=263140 RepID=UPI0024447445|nr:ubiquitin carboxyl-terminal hydrolase 47 isoform X3 [Sitodiplosis mosellana]
MCNLSDMVCYDEGSAQCIILNMMPGAITKRIILMVRPSNKVSTLFNDIKNQMQVDNFDISLQTSSPEEEEILISENEDKTLSDIGIDFSSKKRTTIKLVPINHSMHRRSAIVSEADSTLPSSLDDEELALGASASPVEPTSSPIPLPLFSEEPVTRNHNDSISLYPSSSSRLSSGYVGLVNQAMTCYLNSLLQALYMTPEFRNALYNWEHDGSDAAKNIPYQLQRLFVNLQTSTKMSVETTDLTRSFGWDSTEAWQQHDIQELCRVMFDTLEQKFKDTAQADFINRLYEGRMIDYVKCLDCGTEKSREDKFLDIPLPVRPFGSTIAYDSVEEALRAFVEPETLDGNNQYHCDKCNKKCNAHKGLKFSKFPYILTLHLKRFDFDYQTFLRIKLNDKVTFPQTLNLNSFIKESDANNVFAHTNSSSTHCDTTSSEHEEDVASTNTSNANHRPDLEAPDDDEGIDMTSSSTESKSILGSDPGPYNYELFSIMIHSGSASGGHYYAYIKEFENGEWFCFNDQSVSPISKEDIEKSYGGSLGARTFYSSAYSSSTNAYMLMYRQIDPRRNVSAIKREAFPEHIKQLQNTLKEEHEKKQRSTDYNLQKYKVYWFDQRTQQMANVRMFLGSDATLEEALESAHKRFKLQNIVPMSRCRLVAYDSNEENVLCSFDGKESEQIRDLLSELSSSELLLETRDEDSKFEVYVPGDIETKVYTVEMCSADIDGPSNVRIHKNATVRKYKEKLAQSLSVPIDEILLAAFKYSSTAALLDVDTSILSDEDVNHKSKIFLTSKARSTDSKKFLKIVDRSNHIISLYFTLPKTDKETLEKLSIPSYDPSATKLSPGIHNNLASSLTISRPQLGDVVDAVMKSPPIVQLDYRSATNSAHNQMEPESNSEDSSLSDGDRTLVGDVSPMLSASNSPACSDQHLSSPEDHTKINGDAYGDDDTDMLDVNQAAKKYYFKATYYEEPIIVDNNEEPIRRTLSVLVDSHINVANLKRVLEPYIKVPMEYFKIFRHNSSQNEIECTRLTEDLRSFNDGERLTIELGRALRSGEYKCKVYYMKLSEISETSETLTFLCDWILCNGASVGKTKREILSQIASNDPQYDIPYERCRLRKKSTYAPSKIFLDDQVFGDDVILLSNYEIILQELEEPSQQVTDDKSLTIFIRRWNPTQMSLGPFNEVTVYEKDNMKSVLSQHSGIPEENIEFAKVQGTFPHHSVSILEIHTSLLWNSNPTTLNEFPLSNSQDGIMFFYRDKTEELKQLTPQERQELKNQDARNGYGASSSYDRMSRRRERALKIYVDSSPKKRDE